MSVEVIRGGAALRAGPRVWPLKELLPAVALDAGRRRITHAEPLDEQWIRLTLDDGSQHAARMSSTEFEPDGPADLLLRSARQLLTFDEDHGVGLREHVTIACRAGRVIGLHPGDAPTDAIETTHDATIVDARESVVAPGLIDPHTHPVFGGTRFVEFAMKAEGRSYLEIHQAGGGIFSTVRATRETTFDALAERCRDNLSRLLAWGVTTCEAKSGYALEVEGELRMLEVIRAVSACHPVDMVPTLLAAHAVPPEHAEQRQRYVAQVAEEMIPRAAADGLALYCDAFCEEGAFSADEVRVVFEAARAAGLGLRLHAEQFTNRGGARLAAELGAASADHLEQIDDDAIAAMARAGTVAVLLPGAALACRCPWPPAAKLHEAGVPIALGTDLNPGSSFTASLPLMMSIACMRMGMSVDLVWRAVTREAARSLGRDDIGRIAVGTRADFVIFDVPDYRVVPYHYGENHLRMAIKRGQIVHRNR